MTATAARTPLVDAAEVRRALRLLLPAGQLTELRILDAQTSSGGWPCTMTGYFDDADKLVSALDAVRSAKGIYIIPNPVNRDLLARAANRIKRAGKGDSTSDDHILRRRWLLIDVDDDQRPTGVSATDQEHEAALQRTIKIKDALHYGYGWPEPIHADSANGGHLLYAIDLPVDDGGLVERCLQALSAQFTDDVCKVDTSVGNPSRIWKLYGTTAAKGDNIPERPHRMARILSAPEEMAVVDLELIEVLAAEAPQQPEPERPEFSSNGHAFDLDEFIRRAGLDLDGPAAWKGTGRKWTFNQSPMCEHHDDGPFLAQQPDGKPVAGCLHESCQWKWQDLRSKFEPGCYDRRERHHEQNQHAKVGDDEPRENRFIAHNITSAELATNTYDTEFLVAKKLVANQPGLVAAPKKGMKTSIMADLGVSLASGLPFLREFEVLRPCRVAFLSGESGIATLKETALRVCKAAGCNLEDLDGLHWNEELPRFERDVDLADFADYIHHVEIEVAIIDPAYMCMDGERAGNLFSQGTLLRNVARTCLDAGATPIIVHHLKKNIANPFDPPELEDVSWSGFQEFARQWYLISRRAKYEPESGQHALWMNVGSSVGFSYLYAIDIAEGVYGSLEGRYWDVTISRPDEARKDARQQQEESRRQKQQERDAAEHDEAKKKIVQVLAKLPDGETESALRPLVGMSPRRIAPAIAELLDNGDLVLTQITKNRQTYDAIKLNS